MGSFGTTEILLILIVGFILLGSKGLSKLAKTIGHIFGEFTKVREDFEESIYDVKDSINDVKKEISTTINPALKNRPQRKNERVKGKNENKNKEKNINNTKGDKKDV